MFNFLKVTLFHGCFLRLLNRTNGTKSRKASQMKKIILCEDLKLALNTGKLMVGFPPKFIHIVLKPCECP